MTPEQLRAIGVVDVDTALRFIHELTGQGVTDDAIEALFPSLEQALRDSPDPDRALKSFSRWFVTVGGRYSHLQLLLRHPIALRLFCLVTGSSQYFADLLVRQPEYFEIIANPGVRGGTKSVATFYREVSASVNVCQQPSLKRDVLRRWKAREMLRIGSRDLLWLSDMPSTAREFSNLADASVQCAFDITQSLLSLSPESESPRFAIIAMGKLGGQELNYSSDIDLLFVHGDDLPYEILTKEGKRLETIVWLGRFAENLIKVLAEESQNGHVFRVDMRLRPEGRFGPLTRSLSSFHAYYESWAENWERQALLKARFVAGDRALGETYLHIAQDFAYQKRVTSTFMEDVIENKRRIERHCALEGETETNIKTGYGGIRDIEFILQRFQLERGGRIERIRTGNTIHGLERLQQAGFLPETDAKALSEDYVFLRNLEHRLQLLHDFQTQNLPQAHQKEERTQLARRMGFTTSDSFEQELAIRRKRVHSLLEQHFYAYEPCKDHDPVPSQATGTYWNELHDLLDNLDAPTAKTRLAQLLTNAGFHDLASAFRALQLPMRGNEFGEMPPDTPLEFKRIAARLMELCARSPQPDLALRGIESLATAVPNRAQLYAAFDDSPEVLSRLVALASASPLLFQSLVSNLEWMEGLLATDIEEEQEAEPLAAQASSRIRSTKTEDAALTALAHFWQRESLRIGAREIWGDTNVLQTMGSLTGLADAMLNALVLLATQSIISTHSDPEFAGRVLGRVALVGLGKLGGGELGYSSDWDVVFVYDESRHADDIARKEQQYPLANSLVEKVIHYGKSLAQRGAPIEIDLRLRPWGRAGSLIHSPQGLMRYYHGSMETWERHASLKARYLAGNPHVGQRFERILQTISFWRGITQEEDNAIRQMKERIERERVKPDQRETNLKLGSGGLSDIEWIAQRLQLLHGRKYRTLRISSTLKALSALATAHFLDNAETDTLSTSYLLLTRVRNALWLLYGTGHDALPQSSEQRHTLAKLLGYTNQGEESAEERLFAEMHSCTREVRRIFERRFMVS